MKPVKCVCGGSAVEYLQIDQAIICWVCPREVRGYTPKEAILMWNAAQKELKKRKKKPTEWHCDYCGSGRDDRQGHTTDCSRPKGCKGGLK